MYPLKKEMDKRRFEILLIEDDADDAELTLLALRKHDLITPILHIDDGEKALDFLFGPERDPTLILLDLKMPLTSGFDVLEWIREQAALASVVVVVMSGSKNDADIDRAYALGANHYLIKPTRFEEMVKMMETLKDYTAWAKHGKGGGSSRPATTPFLSRPVASLV